MKYMGSKRELLCKGLGDAILHQALSAERIVDLFSGSGAVSIFAAQRTSRPVMAVDLQHYAVSLAASVIERDHAVDPTWITDTWLGSARSLREDTANWPVYARQGLVRFGAETVKRARRMAEDAPDGSIVNAYGGHYFSLSQAATLDALLQTMPADPKARSICSAALISAGSKCAASPGHTAQPFQPTKTALPFIQKAWSHDPIAIAQQALEEIAPRHAQAEGIALRADANVIAAGLERTDVVIVDPPYSAVQYSRFYHVLEALARGQVGPVSGVGRYEPQTQRPQSSFSLRTQARAACEQLLTTLAEIGCRVIFTFPVATSSNGLSGRDVVEIAASRFKVSEVVVDGIFSTLGGNGARRPARHASEELVITMVPRAARNRRPGATESKESPGCQASSDRIHAVI